MCGSCRKVQRQYREGNSGVTRLSSIPDACTRLIFFWLNVWRRTQVAKDALDKKFGGKWHVVMGNDFGYEVTHEVRCKSCHHSSITSMDVSMSLGSRCIMAGVQRFWCTRLLKGGSWLQCKTMLHVYVGGKMGILAWKLA